MYFYTFIHICTYHEHDHADLGGPQPHRSIHQLQGRQRSDRRLRNWFNHPPQVGFLSTPGRLVDESYQAKKNSFLLFRGTVLKVKVLGVFAMIDEGETDWKVMAIDVNDPLAENLNDIQDVDKIMPGFLKVNIYKQLKQT